MYKLDQVVKVDLVSRKQSWLETDIRCWMNPINHYRRQKKFGQGSIFRSVCQSFLVGLPSLARGAVFEGAILRVDAMKGGSMKGGTANRVLWRVGSMKGIPWRGDSVKGGAMKEPPGRATSGQYASYLNAFLFCNWNQFFYEHLAPIWVRKEPSLHSAITKYVAHQSVPILNTYLIPSRQLNTCHWKKKVGGNFQLWYYSSTVRNYTDSFTAPDWNAFRVVLIWKAKEQISSQAKLILKWQCIFRKTEICLWSP